eukprot:1546257-Pleurochrysis_carterae.AAC.3
MLDSDAIARALRERRCRRQVPAGAMLVVNHEYLSTLVCPCSLSAWGLPEVDPPLGLAPPGGGSATITCVSKVHHLGRACR